MDVIIDHIVILTFAIPTQEKVFPSEGCIHAVCVQPKRLLKVEQLIKESKLHLFTLGFLWLIILKVNCLFWTC